MANRRLTWTLPNVSTQQADIAHTRIEFRVDPTLPWTVQDLVTADVVQELLFLDVNPGIFYYQATVVDVVGGEGPPVETSAVGAYDLPGAVTDFLATEE